MDHRLAALQDEIGRIMADGPIGHWSSVPASFPFVTETVEFNPDGSGRITSWSALSGTSVQAFAWSMEAPGRIVMRYRLTRHIERRDDVLDEPDESAELSPVVFGIAIGVQDTQVGAWPVMVSAGSDCFDSMPTALARTEPPLTLPESVAALRPNRSFLSRVLSWTRPRRHANA